MDHMYKVHKKTLRGKDTKAAIKEKAMKMLKSKLYQIELEKVNKEKDERDSKKLKIDFGSQIRNYVLHPYKMIKDVRTNIERGDVNNVLDGDINDFIKGFLLMSK